jgi:integrase
LLFKSLANFGRNAPRLIARQQFRRRTPSGFILEINVASACPSRLRTTKRRLVIRPSKTAGSGVASWHPLPHKPTIKMVQKRMGHSSITVTADLYSHLFPSNDDGSELREAEKFFAV